MISTELNARKAGAARASLDQAGVGAAATILVGDALETLAAVPGPVELVLLDGWKDLCLPVLRLLEPRLVPGALVAADDITHGTMAGYLRYVRDPANGHVTASPSRSPTGWSCAPGPAPDPPRRSWRRRADAGQPAGLIHRVFENRPHRAHAPDSLIRHPLVT